MATETWTPPPDVLFSLPETGGPVSFAITVDVQGVDPVTGEPAPIAVTGYHGSVTPEQDVVEVKGGPAGLSVTAGSLKGLFPIVSVRYREGDSVITVPDWDSLPESADEVVTFKPGTEATRAYRLDVTADLADGSEAYMSYLMEIHHEWTAGRDRLKEEVDARRNKKG